MRGISDIPQPDRAVSAAAGQRAPSALKRHRVHKAAAADQRMAEPTGVRGISDIPQPDRAVEAAAGQRASVSAKRYRAHAASDDAASRGRSVTAEIQGTAEPTGVRGIGDIPQLDRTPSVTTGQRAPARAERHRVYRAAHWAAAVGQRMAEPTGMQGIGDIPQPDRAVGFAGQQVPARLKATAPTELPSAKEEDDGVFSVSSRREARSAVGCMR